MKSKLRGSWASLARNRVKVLAVVSIVATAALALTWTVPSIARISGLASSPGSASSDDCTVIVTASDSIQAAIDVSPGSLSDPRVICLDGTFGQSVVFDATDVFITLDGQGTAVLDGSLVPATGATTVDGIRLDAGAREVTISGLTIRNFKGDEGPNDRSSAIVAAAGTTSFISVRDNVLKDNFWNGILVFSEGDFLHNNWDVRDNLVEGNGFVGIELTNTIDSKVRENTVEGNVKAGILIQARNTLGITFSPVVSGVDVEENEVTTTGVGLSSSFRPGIWFLALESISTGPDFPTGTFAARITDSEIEDNFVHDNELQGILVQAFNPGAVIDDVDVEENEVTGNGGVGIGLINVDDSEIEENVATGNVGDDISQDAESTGNEFEDNTCGTSSDAGIDCP